MHQKRQALPVPRYWHCNFLSASDSCDHCMPVLKVPDKDDVVLLVMPLLRMYDDPPFETSGEAITLFGKMFEVGAGKTRSHFASISDSRDCNSCTNTTLRIGS